MGKEMEKRAEMIEVLEAGLDMCSVRVCRVGAARVRVCTMADFAVLSIGLAGCCRSDMKR